MEKYRTLETLSKIIIFIAWLTLISAGIGSIYSITKELELVWIFSIIFGGALWFVILLGFGKLIQLALDIRKHQIAINEKKISNLVEDGENIQIRYSRKKRNSEQIENFETVVSEISGLITKQKTSLIGNKQKGEIISLLNEVLTSQEKAKFLMEEYFKHYETSLIDDLKKLTSSYSGIKEYLLPFIELNILKEEYPHELIE
ncbi:MAG: hypothetical protein U1C46_00315 [Bacteroidales bacterium]|nr:hypothetical protein [Bacteroidales bacterium]